MNIFKKLIPLFCLYLCLPLQAQQTDHTENSIPLSQEKTVVKKKQLTAKLDSLLSANAPRKEIIKAQLILCNFLLHKGEFKQEQKILIMDLLSKLDKDDEAKTYARVLSYLGINQYHLGEFQKAINTHYQAIELKQKIKSPSISWNYELIGNNLMATENYEAAIKILQKSLELSTNKNPRPKLIQRIGRAYMNMSNFDLAEQYLLQSIEIAKNANNRMMQGTSKTLLAEAYYKQKKYQSSIAALNESLTLRAGIMSVQNKINAYDLLAKNYLITKQLDKAQIVADSAYQFAKALDSPGYRQTTLRTLTELSFNQKDYEKAEIYQKLLLQDIDTFYDLENRKNFLDLFTKLDLKEKENEIIKQNLTIEQEKYNRSRLTYLVGFLCLIGLLIGYTLYKRTKYQQILEEKNSIITKSLGEKEILLREIHHRVKNNLQMVSSLLGIQSREIKDGKAKKAINEGRTRVHSMSLIHQDLYRKDNLTGVEMQKYLPKLSKDLLNAYSINDDRIKMQLDIQSIKLDVETVIPIGLIINELVTNALKYAFPNNRSGIISISLQEINDTINLTVADNGIGLDTAQLEKKEASFGHSLIKAFKEKLKADIAIDGKNGTAVTLVIKNYKIIDV